MFFDFGFPGKQNANLKNACASPGNAYAHQRKRSLYFRGGHFASLGCAEMQSRGAEDVMENHDGKLTARCRASERSPPPRGENRFRRSGNRFCESVKRFSQNVQHILRKGTNLRTRKHAILRTAKHPILRTTKHTILRTAKHPILRTAKHTILRTAFRQFLGWGFV